MRSVPFRVAVFLLSVLLVIPPAAIPQPLQTSGANPPIAQPLMREGDFAVDLAEALKLGTAMSEPEAESTLSSFGITPRNGWIADYPVTPDIIGEVQASISEAANSGKLSVGKDAALAAVQDVLRANDMSVRTAEGQPSGVASSANYPESAVIDDYYSSEGPPVVTYYAPPPDYAYLYTWVPYPFWWSDFWFGGFFVLVDFNVIVHGHGHEHGHGRGHDGVITNHFRDLRTGRITRIDPTNRFRRGAFPQTGDMRRVSPPAQIGGQAIPSNRTEAYRHSRGYDIVRPSTSTRSSAFDRSTSSRIERGASNRGFQSRSQAGQIPARTPTGGGTVRGGGGGGQYHGSGRRW